MNFKRIISGLILFPLVAILLIFGNTYVVDVTIAVVAILSLYEFYKSFEGKAKPVTWLGYIAAASISLKHLVPQGMTLKLVGIIIPLSILLLLLIFLEFLSIKTPPLNTHYIISKWVVIYNTKSIK